MSEADRVDMPEATQGEPAPQETGISEEAAQLELGTPLRAEAEPSPEGETAGEPGTPEEETAGEAAHALSGATLEAMTRTDPVAQAQAEEERQKWERRKAMVRERVSGWCRRYMADGGFKLGISLVTAVIAAAIIVIAGIFSDRQLGVVFWRAVIGFFVSGIFMGGTLYWLDRIGIPLFIAKHEDQIQMEWLAEAEEPEGGGEEQPEGEEAEPEEELEELLKPEGEETPQDGENAPPEGEEAAQEGEEAPAEGEEASGETAETTETAEASAEETPADAGGEPRENETAEPEPPPEEGGPQDGAGTGEAPESGMDGLENAVLDDAFSSGEEPAEPPAFAPMTSENLESLSVPEG